MIRYKEAMEFMESNHRNPLRHRLEEHDMLNWIKHNRKLMNAGKQDTSSKQMRRAAAVCRDVVLRWYSSLRLSQ